ncbi:MAG: hypothetical protein F6J92_23735 [Symploca sp. SIO1A3]|nr:hypothetical protein [Symploca sp. SIO1A3]
MYKRLATLLSFVFLILIGCRIYVHHRQRNIDKKAKELSSRITNPIKNKLESHLGIPHKVNEQNAEAIKSDQFDFTGSGLFSLEDFQYLEELFRMRLQEPDFKKKVNNNYIGTEGGDFVGTESEPRQEDKWRFIISTSTKNKFEPTTNLRTLKDFDPRVRPWYKSVKNSCKPTWSQVYRDKSSGQLALTAVHPICDESNKLIAVLGSDFLFPEINDFLKELITENLIKTSISVETFIMESSGALVATSKHTKVIDKEGAREERIKATNSDNELISEAAKTVAQNKSGSNNGENQLLNFNFKGKRQFIQVISLTDKYGLDLSLVVIVPESEIREEIDFITVSSVLLDAGLLLAVAAAITVSFALYIHERERLLNAALIFVPGELLKLLEIEDITALRLGDQVEREMTIMFADIRSFTNLSEQMEPQENFNFINEYLGKVSPVIREHGGIVANFIGDGIMALFPQSAEAAVQAAINMQHQVSDFNQERQDNNKPPIAIGIGLHTGIVMLGTIGEPKRLQVTVISKHVNLASRLEGLTKVYGSRILISRETRNQINPSNYHCRFLGLVRAKGCNQPAEVYEIYDTEPQRIIEPTDQTQARFKSAYQHYRSRRFIEAQQVFDEILLINPKDRAAKWYVERCNYYQQYGVPNDWEGIEIFN